MSLPLVHLNGRTCLILIPACTDAAVPKSRPGKASTVSADKTVGQLWCGIEARARDRFHPGLVGSQCSHGSQAVFAQAKDLGTPNCFELLGDQNMPVRPDLRMTHRTYHRTDHAWSGGRRSSTSHISFIKKTLGIPRDSQQNGRQRPCRCQCNHPLM